MHSSLPPASPAVSSCWSCGLLIDAGDRFCRGCGKEQGRHVAWYYQHWGIIVITVFGLGPFSLFLVWRSPILSSAAKWAYSAAILLATAYVGYRAYQLWIIMNAAMAAYMQNLGL